jgi:site-specific DNA-methyltransferase (adenine-specific)
LKTSFEIYNDDCIEVLKRIESDKIDMILSDIPYGEVNRDSGGLRELDKANADVVNFDLNVLISEFVRVCSGSFYVFCGTRQISEIISVFDKYGMTTRLGVWEKTNPSPMNGQRMWLSGLEFCVFARKAKATFNENCKSAIWKFPSGMSKIHPTQKPVVLMERLIAASTNEGDVVADFTMGSGTTGCAAGNLNRNFIGVEIDKNFFHLAKKRIEKSYSSDKVSNFFVD